MKLNRKLSVLLLLVLAFTIVLPGSASSQLFKDTYSIRVVVHGGIADPFWKVVEKGVMDAASNHPDLRVVYSGPPSFDLPKFISDIETALASEPDALVCTLTEPAAMDELLRPAIAKGLTVVAINAPDLRTDGIPVDTYIGEDPYYIGVAAAEESMKRFTPKRAVYVNHHPGASNIEARGRGFIETLAKYGVKADQLNITADAVQGAEITSAYLKTNPDVDLIFSGNTQRTEAIIARLEDDGVKVGTDVKIAQMDMSPQILEYLQDGKIMFVLDQQQYMQGYLGVELAYLKVKYGLYPPPAPVSTGPGVITAEDIARLNALAAEDYR